MLADWQNVTTPLVVIQFCWLNAKDELGTKHYNQVVLLRFWKIDDGCEIGEIRPATKANEPSRNDGS